MKERIIFGNHRGFLLISIIAVLVILCILATIELAKYLSPGNDKSEISQRPKNIVSMAAPKIDNLSDNARNIAGVAALDAATSNVQMAYAKLLISNTSGKSIPNEAVVNLLNSSYSNVGDYIVSYSTTGADKVTATLQANSRGKFGKPNSKEISLNR